MEIRRSLAVFVMLALFLSGLVVPNVSAAPDGYRWTFDVDASGWTVSPTGGSGWALYEAAGREGLGWATNEPGTSYANGLTTHLTSPLLDLSAVGRPTLVFDIRGSAEPGWDYLHVEARNGPVFEVVTSIDSAFEDWTQVRVPLYWIEASTQLRFRFASDSSVPGDGYQIDNIVVASIPEFGLQAAERFVSVGTAVRFTLQVPTDGITAARLDLGDGNVIVPPAGESTVDHTYAVAGNHLARLVVETPYVSVEQAVSVLVRAEDPFGSRVVVAIIDSGINPYHETYHRPGINLPLDDFRDVRTGRAPRPVPLTFTNDYQLNVGADAAAWDSIRPGELVYFPGTNVLGVDFDPTSNRVAVRDVGGHGTATSDTLLDVFPEAIIVMVQTDALALSSSLPDALQWAVEQPWIDVLSVSMGMPGNAPEPAFIYPIAKMQRQAWEAGKLWFESSGNDPSPLITDGLDGSPWAISVTGSHQGGQRKETSSSTVYPDIASNYTVEAAVHVGVGGDRTISGTSFSCPTAAGTVAGALYRLRAEAGWTGGIEDGLLVPPTGTSNHDLRAALNKTAIYPEWDGTILEGGDLGTPPYARFAEIGWGHVDGRLIGDIADVVTSGDYSLPPPPSEKGTAAPYMSATYAARLAYWTPFTI